MTLPLMPAEITAKAVESKVLKEALRDSAQEYIALRRELEMTLLKDIHTLGENELRTRIKQLANEMFERLAWEDMRLQQSLRGVEQELVSKFTDLLTKQRAELEFEVKKILLEVEKNVLSREAGLSQRLDVKYQKQLAEAIRAQAEGFQATMQRELDSQQHRIHEELNSQLNHQVAVLRQSQVEQLMELEPKIAEVQSQFSELLQVAEAAAASVRDTKLSNAYSAAVLALELALSTSGGDDPDDARVVPARFASVASLAEQLPEEQLVTHMLHTLPDTLKERGALPLSELQLRFRVMRQEVRKAALAPEAAPKLVGQLIGSGLAAISWAPTGLVPGPGVEEALARADYYCKRGELQRCVAELDGVTGYPQVLMADWKQLAQDRILADKTMEVLKARTVVRHKALS